jgi:hypothetical protein
VGRVRKEAIDPRRVQACDEETQNNEFHLTNFR